MKTIATISLYTAALLASVTLTSCTDHPSPGLTLTPVESKRTGDSFAYRVQYEGQSTAYRIDMELFEAGKLTAKRQLLAGNLADLAQDSIQDKSIEMLLQFVVTDPRRDGESTEITAVLSGPAMSYHKDIQIAEWDALGGKAGYVHGGHYERIHFQSTSEPIVLHRWWKGEALNSLTDPRALDSPVCMQLTLRLEK